jgi:hypothetical protein
MIKTTVLLTAVVLLIGCGSGNTPTSPPIPTPIATPPIVATVPPLSISCSKLPPGSLTPQCGEEASEYREIVEEAIRTLQGEQPNIFKGNQVVSVGAYYVGLIQILDRSGLCAASDGEELGVARSAGMNEQFDILTARNEVRTGPAMYRTTCAPSAVPIIRGALPPSPAGCSLPPSREIACSREDSGRFLDDVNTVVAQVLKEHPDLFGEGWMPGTGLEIINRPGFGTAIVDHLTTLGYCAKDGGEEFELKKGTNMYSEQYDLVQDLEGKIYLRVGSGTYRATCYPAVF